MSPPAYLRARRLLAPFRNLATKGVLWRLLVFQTLVWHLHGRLGDASGLGRILWNESTVPLRQLTAILYQPSADPLERDKQLEKLRFAKRKEDQIWLTSGEVISPP